MDKNFDSTYKFKVSLLQAGRSHTRKGNPGFKANFDLFSEMAVKAAGDKPDLIVFPEYTISGHPYPKKELINEIAEAVPGGDWYGRYAKLAAALDTALLGWVLEKEDGKLYNTAFLIERDGTFIGKYRKVHCTYTEMTSWGWSQGEGFNLIDFRGLKIGVSICADMWMPETLLCESLLGADVIIHISVADDMEHILPVRALDNMTPIALSIFDGGCYAVDTGGRLLGKAQTEEPGWMTFELEPFKKDTRRTWWSKFGGQTVLKNECYNRRKPSAYGIITDPSTRRPWTEVFLDEKGNRQTAEQIKESFNGIYDADDPELYHIPPVCFQGVFSSHYRVDPKFPYHLVNREGKHLFILNKTAWAYFMCKDPEGVLKKAKAQGVNVLRVALEGYLYNDGYNMWPWLGTRDNPDWEAFNEGYWRQAEERVKLAGEYGIGLDLVLYARLRKTEADILQQRPYWREILWRFARYSNIVTWEIMNEYIKNEVFQDVAGVYMKQRDPYGRPVCSSDGTTDNALWPHKEWMDLAVNHSCTSSLEKHDLRNWYLAVAANTRSHGKPAWCNESGREARHKNDDPVHRRKQGWIWCAAGAFWTFHSWEGCEGIDDLSYQGPGGEYLKSMKEFFDGLPFWEMSPNYTALTVRNSRLLTAILAEQESRVIAGYVCSLSTGETVDSEVMYLRLPNGIYKLSMIDPSTGDIIETREHRSGGIGKKSEVLLPSFTDDLAILIEVLDKQEKTLIEGTL